MIGAETVAGAVVNPALADLATSKTATEYVINPLRLSSTAVEPSVAMYALTTKQRVDQTEFRFQREF